MKPPCQYFHMVLQLSPHVLTQTIANSNQKRFPMDFPNTWNVILPCVTCTLNNLYLQLTRSIFCFPSNHFYITWPSITQIKFNKAPYNSKTKTEHLSPKHWIYFKKPVSIVCLYFYGTLEFKFSVQLCILIKLCCLIAFPPHPLDYFIFSGYFPWTPNNSNFFDFPRRFKLSWVDFTCFSEFQKIKILSFWEKKGLRIFT